MARRTKQQRIRTPLIVIKYEGEKKTTEECYFRNFRNRNLRIEFSTGGSTDPSGMVKDLLNYIRNEDIKSEDNCRIFLVLDTDLDERRIKEIKEINTICKENNIDIIISTPTFEIWYLMHYRNNQLKFLSSKEVKKAIEKIYGEYKETTNMYEKIKYIQEYAIKNAKKIAESVTKSNEDKLYANPYTEIYKIIEVIDEYNKLNKRP